LVITHDAYEQASTLTIFGLGYTGFRHTITLELPTNLSIEGLRIQNQALERLVGEQRERECIAY
jgi:hypothetical protein